MEKTKLAICFADAEYQNRFLRCWMHHFEELYEIHIFTEVEELLGWKERGAVILLEGEGAESGFEESSNLVIRLLEADEGCNAGDGVVFKYQELYKIEHQIKMLLQKKYDGRTGVEKTRKMIGVFSVDKESCQIPFCGMIASEYGELGNTILLNLQVASGLEEDEKLGMEELLVAAATQNYTRAGLQDTIVSEKNWDYVNPARNSQCLAEGNMKLYDSVMDILEREMGYVAFVINFGQFFEECTDWMERCDSFYCLVHQKDRISSREQAFLTELKRKEKKRLLQNMTRIEIPQTVNPYESWRALAEKWRWSMLGDEVRMQIRAGQ